MKQITINGNKYTIPTKWEDVTLKQQMLVSEYTSKFENESLQKIAILAAYANMPFDELKKASLNEVAKFYNHFDFINTPIPDKPIVEFDFKGNHYHVGQNLLETEFQDFVSIQNILQAKSGSTYQALPTILAIMCKRMKPNGVLETLDDYSVNERAKEFEELPITIAHSISVFFYHTTNTLSAIILLSSNPKEVAQRQINLTRDIITKQGGVGLLMRWLRGISLYYLKFIEKRLDKYFTS